MMGIRVDQVPEYLSQFESSASFLQHMRDKQKPGTNLWYQYDKELRECLGQAQRLKASFDNLSNLSH